MAWVATDNLDSYSAGSNLHGQNGGSDWAAAWSWNSAGTQPTVETAPAGGQGGNAIKVSGTTNQTKATRTFTAISAGIVKLRLRVTATNPNDFCGFILESGAGNGKIYHRVSGGNLQLFNSPAYENVQAVSADTWYRIDVEFDDAAQDNKFRTRVDGGSWTDWKNTNGTYTSLDRIVIDKSNTNAGVDLWVDDIGEGSVLDATGNSYYYYAQQQAVAGLAL